MGISGGTSFLHGSLDEYCNELYPAASIFFLCNIVLTFRTCIVDEFTLSWLYVLGFGNETLMKFHLNI